MRIRIASLLILFFLAACNPSGNAEPVTPPPASEPPVLTASPTPEAAKPLVILALPGDMPAATAAVYQTLIYDLAQASGHRLQMRSSLTESEIQNEPGLAVVVAFPPDPGLGAMAAAAPGVQFLGVGIPGLVPGGNLSAIGSASETSIQQAFVAGYMAAMLSIDYRVGLITPETDAGKKVIQAFSNGRTFYCGLCNPAFPPFTYKYPAHPEIPLGAPLEQYPFYTDFMLDYLVEVAYVHPDIATVDLLNYMATYNLKIIGERLPYDDLRPNWVASIQPDVAPAIERIWPDLVAGVGGQSLATPLYLTDINPNLLPEGKQGEVERMMDDLAAGLIDTGVAP
ncbi:MAG: hypothetical protein FJZ96_14115 [Chloroflexi bacterium]|nr:hypothetical protein [Chloroflexota bacterium]